MPKILNNVKDDICRVTRQMMADEGYENLNVRSVAGKCGIGMGTIYNYYHSKEEIVAEIVLEDWNVILRRMDQANRVGREPMARLESVFGLLQEFIVGFHGTWVQMSMASGTPPDNQGMRCRRHDYRHQLAERVDAATGSKADTFCSDLVARLFLSYAMEPGFQFRQMAPAISGVLKGCSDSA
jgi:AcrR family transcriptional regulator